MALIWTPYTWTDHSAPYYRPGFGCAIALLRGAVICGVAMRLYLQRQNKQLERMEREDCELTPTYLRNLEKTTEYEGIDSAAARAL